MKRLMRNQTITSRSRPLQAEKFVWRSIVLAVALGIMSNMMYTNANALSLGAMTSLSALGEPLAAGIAISEADAKELERSKLVLATPAEYSAMGIEYNAALASAQITLMRRANGTAYLLVHSDKVVNDSFVNVIVQVSWSGGRIVRNYTILINSPTSGAGNTNVITSPISVTTPEPVQAVTPAPVQVELTPSPVASTTPAKTAVSKKVGGQHRVKQGETAGDIASQNLPMNISLDQMLVAMLRGNPKAFEADNVNRLKAGAILDLPNAEDAGKIEAKEARQNILAHSKDFKTFRRNLADNAASVAFQASDRQSGGKIDVVVEDRKEASTSPDKLTLSKANAKTDVKGIKPDESAKIAKERQAQADQSRSAELNKNIADLKTVSVAIAATAATATSAAKPVSSTPAPVVPELSFIDDLMVNPMVLPTTGGVLALLVGWGLYQSRQRNNRVEDEDFEQHDENEATLFNATQDPDKRANKPENAPMEFDFNGLSLDLNDNNKATESAQIDVGPLEIKLALANEFRAMGDISGARILLQEVIARATGTLKSKAESLLSDLG